MCQYKQKGLKGPTRNIVLRCAYNPHMKTGADVKLREKRNSIKLSLHSAIVSCFYPETDCALWT